ncbi:Ig-like domain-containing protein [Neobacillus muris]|uniref:Ig-like domain-containing protein n=1 Tax=Neobacillus muris TaxID=2941334 RepID=UPI002041F813|nr:Ig-like domain-containing protein [Neobacillus muris]
MFNNSKVFADDTVLSPRGYIDSPLNGLTIKGEITVNGWVLDASGVSKVEVLVDGNSMGEAQYGSPRTDVYNAFPEYQNPNSGYTFTLNTKNLSNGQHTLAIKESGNNGSANILQSVTVNVQNLQAKGYIDAPLYGSVVKGDIDVSGWFLDASGVSKIEVLVDGIFRGEAQTGLARTDVGNAYPEYQNANSGYKFTLNTKNLSNGQHTITVKETGNNGAATTQSVKVNVQNSPVRVYMDSPSNGSTVKGDIEVSGWLLDSSGVSKIEVLVDGKSMGEAQYGTSRSDVYSAFPEYQTPNPGYKFTLNTRNLTNGQHAVTIRETGNNGAVNTFESSTVNVQNSPIRGYMDSPANGSSIKEDVEVSGWFLDASGVSKIEVLVDGKSMGEAQYGIPRNDVYSAFPEYQTPNPGYKFTLKTKNLSNGQHTVQVKETGKNGAVNTLDRVTVNVQNLPAKGYIDSPANGASIKGDVEVSGWFLDASGVSKIEVLIDGVVQSQAQYGFSRTDVGNAFPEYQNSNSGYKGVLNTKNLTNGQHTLTVRETGSNGAENQQSVAVNVQNPSPVGSIDSPLSGTTVKGDISVNGWYLDMSGVSKIEVYVDGQLKGEAQYGSARPDVQQAFPEFQNGNSGYQFSLNTLQFSEGQHTLTVKETGRNGSTSSLSSIIYVFNGNPYTQIDLRKPANITAADIVNFFNQKRPDSPLKAYAQSFIDAQNKYGVNAQYLVAHAIWETGWGFSNLSIYKHNLYGYGAYNSCPFTCAYYFPNGGDSIIYEAFIVRQNYLNETGSYYNGPTLQGMNVRYATDQSWANGIANLMQSIKPFDATSYFQSTVMPSSPEAPPTFGRNIPEGQPYPASIMINMDKDATVTTDGLSFRILPYVSTSTLIRKLGAGTPVKVLGYNSDVSYYPGDSSKYPYDSLWYRVIVDGQEGWLYGGGILFNN